MKSPFRYPGAKSRLLKKFRPLLDHLIQDNCEVYCEPFVGGGSVGLYVAEAYPLLPLWFNDLDPWMSAFWNVIASGDDEDIGELKTLLRNKPTIERFEWMRAGSPKNDVWAAYYAVFFNRTTFSGILDAGPIGGREQKSKWTVDCRYNAATLLEAVDHLRQLLSGRLAVTCEHAISFISQRSHSSVVMYVDPPYFEKGQELYPVHMTSMQHSDLAKTLKESQARWILSYDSCDVIRGLYTGTPALEIDARYSVSGQDRENWVGKSELLFCNDRSVSLSNLVSQ